MDDAERRRAYHREYKRKRRAADPEFRRKDSEATRRSEIKREYGLTIEQYHALFEVNDGYCPICGADVNEIRFDVDHDHATGRIRAVICHQCNKGLGNFKDNPILLENAARYLRMYHNDTEGDF